MKKIILITLVILPFTIVKPSFAFEPLYHRIITTDALDQDGFDNQSIITVYDRNTWVDIRYPHIDEAHGDNDKLADTSGRLRDFRDFIINDLASCKRDSALLKLGEALHTVQDIYSHTNPDDVINQIADLVSWKNHLVTKCHFILKQDAIEFMNDHELGR